MSHTPGPWGYGHEIHLVGNGGIYDGQDTSEEVFDATVFAGEGEDWEPIATGITSEDNARLIAAAPDMKDEIDRLKAEKAELLEALEEVINSNPSILATERSALRYVQAVEKARKVIQKARGEE
nr:hypothetical protein [uncultured Dethiosulfovibrio sp.]